jgi:hypothetical protein
VGARTFRRVARTTVLFAALALVLSAAGVASAAVPLTTISTDPYTNTTSHHKTEVEPDTYSFGSTIVSTFQVGRFTDGGASNLGWATSEDNGVTWTNGFLPGTTVYANPPGTWARISDPTVVYDAKHGVWMIVGLVIDQFVSPHGLVVNRSTDGGLTWQNPVSVDLNNGSYDKQWVTCDNTASSPFYGNCYTEWAGSTGIMMTRSSDGGLTWQRSQTPFAFGNGGQPVVQNDGKVVVPYAGSGIQTIVSTNGGASFSGPFTAATVTSHAPAGSIRAPLLPSAEVDGAGKIYVTWPDCRFRSGCASNDIVMTTSANGSTWTSPVRIPIDAVNSGADHFIPGIAADKSTQGSTAHLGLAFYFYPRANCTSDTCKLQGGFISSQDGGTTWSRPVRVVGPMRLKWLPFTTLGYMVGDYISTSFGSNGKAYPVMANAHFTGTNCVVGNITACDEFMVAPTNGLVPGPGVVPVDRNEPVVVKPTSLPLGVPALP